MYYEKNTFEIKKLLFAKELTNNRVTSFRNWRKLVSANPNKFRIAIFKIPKTSTFIGGVVFGLEELVESKTHVQTVYQPDATAPVVVLGPSEVKASKVLDWTIIGYTDVWITD